MREIIFRGKRLDNSEWVYGYLYIDETGTYIKVSDRGSRFGCGAPVIPESVGQFTGHTIKDIDLYEGDIVRLEENGEGVDPLDKITFYVVTYIKEWCMFSLLRIEDEYSEYINGDIDNLDTTMFWTFPLDVEDIGPSQHYLCGNIHDNPELLQQ